MSCLSPQGFLYLSNGAVDQSINGVAYLHQNRVYVYLSGSEQGVLPDIGTVAACVCNGADDFLGLHQVNLSGGV
jgi:hypothetical protein